MRARHLRIRGKNHDYGFDTRATEENTKGYVMRFYIYKDGNKDEVLWDDFSEEEKSRISTLAKKFSITI